MKKLPLFVTAALASAVLSLNAFAGSANTACTANAACAAKVAAGPKPTPVHVVHPVNLPRGFVNATVRIDFVIDAQGIPHDIKPVGWWPSDVATPLIAAFRQWRFSPQMENGRPVVTHVILPLTLVAES